MGAIAACIICSVGDCMASPLPGVLICQLHHRSDLLHGANVIPLEHRRDGIVDCCKWVVHGGRVPPLILLGLVLSTNFSYPATVIRVVKRNLRHGHLPKLSRYPYFDRLLENVGRDENNRSFKNGKWTLHGRYDRPCGMPTVAKLLDALPHSHVLLHLLLRFPCLVT